MADKSVAPAGKRPAISEEERIARRKASALSWYYRNRESSLAYKAKYDQAHKEERSAKGKLNEAKNKERRRAQKKIYRAANKARVAAQYQANKVAVSAKQAIYYAANADTIKAYQREYGSRHKEQSNATHSAWRAANPEKAKASGARYYAANREKELKRKAAQRAKPGSKEKAKLAGAAWAAKNPDRKRAAKQNRRARERADDGRISPRIASKLMALQGGRCACCKGDLKKLKYHLDHHMPLALGGAHDDANMQLLCPTCNMSKQDKHPVDFMQSRGFLL